MYILTSAMFKRVYYKKQILPQYIKKDLKFFETYFTGKLRYL
jgi:hypothetical protein